MRHLLLQRLALSRSLRGKGVSREGKSLRLLLPAWRGGADCDSIAEGTRAGTGPSGSPFGGAGDFHLRQPFFPPLRLRFSISGRTRAAWENYTYKLG